MKQENQFKSENVTVNVDKMPGCQITLNIVVSPAGSQAAYKKAIKLVNKEVSMPGFRKGKAPDAMILQNFGNYVDSEWKDLLVQTAFQEAMHLTKLLPLNKESIEKPQIKKISKEDESEIVIAFESFPIVPEIDIKSLKLNKVKRETLTEEQIQDGMNNLRYYHAEWTDVADRGVQEGDFVDVDIEDIDQPGRFLCSNTRFEVADGHMGTWMRKLILGKNVNDVVEGVSERPEKYGSHIEFKPTNCRITIKAIKEAKLPPIDEELAKKFGVATVEELRSNVTKNLNNQADEEVQEQLRDQIQAILLESYPFDVPASYLTVDAKKKLQQAQKLMKDSGTSENEIEDKFAVMSKTAEDKALSALRLFFLTRKIAAENDIRVTQDELMKEIVMQAYAQPGHLGSSMDAEDTRIDAYIELLTRKVKDFLIGKATIE